MQEEESLKASHHASFFITSLQTVQDLHVFRGSVQFSDLVQDSTFGS